MKIQINVAGHTHLLFAGVQYYPEGGWDDFRGSHLSIEDAMKAFNTWRQLEEPFRPWAQIVAPHGRIVRKWESNENHPEGGRWQEYA